LTNPDGKVFISYRRGRAVEVADLTRRLKVRGIPVWIDISDLGHGASEEQITDALKDEMCAGAVAWLTPEVAGSPVIRRIEVPAIVRRVHGRDGFFAVVAVAGGLDYAEAANVAAENLGTDDLKSWNLHKVDGDPAPGAELDALADLVLRERLRAVAASLPDSDPWRIGIWVRRGAPSDHDDALQLDWHESFNGRQATSDAWKTLLLPALRSIHAELGRVGVERGLVVSGFPTLSTAVAFGRAFPAVAGISVAWDQLAPDGSRDLWSLGALAEENGFSVTTGGSDPRGEGLAVVVSVSQDAGGAYGASSLPAMRTVIEVTPAAGRTAKQLTAGGARQLAHEVADAVRRAKTTHISAREIHLFLACPAGLAMMIGQLLNAVGPMTVYEHIDDDAVGHYVREVRIPASGLL
jgi:hypothetical protein